MVTHNYGEPLWKVGYLCC